MRGRNAVTRYNRDNDIEYIFRSDSIEKKRVGVGVYNRASRRGYVGTVRTQVDYLKGKAKKEYMGNGEIKVYNFYDDIRNLPTREQFGIMEPEKAKKILEYVKEKHTIATIAKKWGCVGGTVYTTLYKYGVMEEPLSAKERKAKSLKGKAKKTSLGTTVASEVAVTQETNEREEYIAELEGKLKELEPAKKEGFTIELKGVFSREEVEARVLNILGTTVEGKNYSVSLSIKEEM